MIRALRWVDRSPRFVYSLDSQNLVRFAPMETIGLARAVSGMNLSESGLSFKLSRANIETFPEEGDVIKVEFTPPGRPQIACFATVVRVEEEENWQPDTGQELWTKVAVKFRHLPSAHARALQLALRPYVGDKEIHFDAKPRLPLRRWVSLVLSLLGLGMVFIALTAPYPLLLLHFYHWLALSY